MKISYHVRDTAGKSGLPTISIVFELEGKALDRQLATGTDWLRRLEKALDAYASAFPRERDAFPELEREIIQLLAEYASGASREYSGVIANILQAGKLHPSPPFCERHRYGPSPLEGCPICIALKREAPDCFRPAPYVDRFRAALYLLLAETLKDCSASPAQMRESEAHGKALELLGIPPEAPSGNGPASSD